LHKGSLVGVKVLVHEGLDPRLKLPGPGGKFKEHGGSPHVIKKLHAYPYSTQTDSDGAREFPLAEILSIAFYFRRVIIAKRTYSFKGVNNGQGAESREEAD